MSDPNTSLLQPDTTTCYASTDASNKGNAYTAGNTSSRAVQIQDVDGNPSDDIEEVRKWSSNRGHSQRSAEPMPGTSSRSIATSNLSISKRGCYRCGCPTSKGWTFVFPKPDQDDPNQKIPKCPKCAIRHWPMIRRSLCVCIIVGTLLTMINQGDFIVKGHFTPDMRWKIPLTYCVPFSVATYGALSNCRQ